MLPFSREWLSPRAGTDWTPTPRRSSIVKHNESSRPVLRGPALFVPRASANLALRKAAGCARFTGTVAHPSESATSGRQRLRLYLVRHAAAFTVDLLRWPTDVDRPLTKTGMRNFGLAARGLRALAPRVDVLLASPYLRTRQTAEILHDKARWPEPEIRDALTPGHAIADVLALIQEQAPGSKVAIVGHEPNLTALLSSLTTGSAGNLRHEFKRGGVAFIEIPSSPEGARASLVWSVTPGILRALAKSP